MWGQWSHEQAQSLSFPGPYKNTLKACSCSLLLPCDGSGAWPPSHSPSAGKSNPQKLGAKRLVYATNIGRVGDFASQLKLTGTEPTLLCV